MKKHSLHLLIALWFIFLLLLPTTPIEPVENKNVEVGAAFDVTDVNDDKDYLHKITRNFYLYTADNTIVNENYSGIGYSIGKTREDRQNKTDKVALQGMEKVYLLSQEQARLGIRPCVDILFKNSSLSDNGIFVICNGNGADILELKIPGYISPLDYIYGMIKNSPSNNFFSHHYLMSDIYIRMDGEGRNYVIPFIDVKDNTPYIWGTSLFIKDKMKGKLDINESRVMNLLREDKSKGIISINESNKKYIDFECVSKRKVKCEKKDDKYIFTINLNLKGTIANNEINNDIINDSSIIKEFEALLSKEVEKQCYEFIDKMKRDYKLDWLELGKYAMVKNSRKTKVDWNDIVINNSEIIVKPKVIITNIGRGEY